MRWKIKFIMLMTLMLCTGVFSVSVSADSGETLTVTAAWVDGELLRINVTDADGISSALALRLSDYVDDSENKEYIAIQAVDLAGNKSKVIEIKNPFYEPTASPIVITTPILLESPQDTQEDDAQDGSNPFTPDGSGTVMDNAHDGDGKEFFTIGTDDGSVFYLIIDRQRNSDNVYLLNAVTEQDLIALAEQNGREITASGDNDSVSAITVPSEQPDTTDKTQPPTTEPELPDEPPPVEPPMRNDTSMYIIIAVVVIIVGGAGYYFKIVRGRKNNAADYEDDDNEEDVYGYNDEQDEDYDYGEDSEDGGDGK